MRSLKRQYGSNHNVPDIIFLNKKIHELLVEIDITIRSFEGKYGSNRNVPDAVF